MDTIALTDDDRRFITAIGEAVAERGRDWVYPNDYPWRTSGPDDTCRYTVRVGNRRQPGCIIGFALRKMGASYDYLERRESRAALTVMEQLRRFTFSLAL